LAKVILIAGLPGCGKSTYLKSEFSAEPGWKIIDDYQANARDNSKRFDHGREYEAMTSHLLSGGNCAIADIAFCRTSARTEAEETILRSVPGATIEWRFFENDPQQCRTNVILRSRDSVEKELLRIDQLSKSYVPPSGAVVLPVWTPDGSAEGEWRE
jgi:predicted kinase